jgi:putative peptidoglycan lipid II flippase
MRAGLVSALTLISRIVGYAREAVTAALFGNSSAILDAFLTAWRVPNLFRRLFGEGAIATSFQTEFSEVEGEEGEAAGRAFFWSVFGMLSKILVLLTVVMVALVWLAPNRLTVPGLTDTWPLPRLAWLGPEPEAVREITIRLLPFLIVICLTAVTSSALHVRGLFGATAVAPVVFNAVWIGTLVLLLRSFPDTLQRTELSSQLDMARFLTWGILLAAVVQGLGLLPSLLRSGLAGGGRRSPARARRSPRAVLVRAIPLAIGAAVYQVNVMIDGMMAVSLLPEGGAGAHYFATRIQQFPMAMIAFAATTAVFPALKAFGQKGDLAGMSRLHSQTQRSVAYLALPATAGLLALAYPIVMVMFEYGSYGAEGVARIERALVALSLAVVPVGATGLMVRCFYSLNDFRTPVMVSIAMMGLNLVLNLWFILGLELDADGLALGTATTSWLALALLWPLFRSRHRLPAGPPGLLRSLLTSAAGALACGLAAGLAYRGLCGPLASLLELLGLFDEVETRRRASQVLALLIAVGLGVAAHFGATLALASREAQAVLARLRRSGTR